MATFNARLTSTPRCWACNCCATSENPEYKYSLAFLGFEGGNPGQAEIELTYNWGTESNTSMGTAYGHIALGVPDAYAACEKIKASGGNVTREAGPVAKAAPR